MTKVNATKKIKLARLGILWDVDKDDDEKKEEAELKEKEVHDIRSFLKVSLVEKRDHR